MKTNCVFSSCTEHSDDCSCDAHYELVPKSSCVFKSQHTLPAIRVSADMVSVLLVGAPGDFPHTVVEE